MESVGWASIIDGCLVFPKFDANNTSAAERQQRYRQKLKAKRDVTGDVTGDVTRCATVAPREEKRREDIESGARTRKSIPPTLEEVTQYVEQSDLSMSASQFFDHFQSNGWMVGRNKMRDWQAAVRKWAANQPLFTGRPSKAADDDRSERGNPWR